MLVAWVSERWVKGWRWGSSKGCSPGGVCLPLHTDEWEKWRWVKAEKQKWQEVLKLKWLRASLVAQLVKNPPAMWFDSWVGKIPWRRGRLPALVFLGFPGGSDSKESACNAGDLGSTLGWEGPLEEGMAAHPSILAWRIPMDRGAWRATVHGITWLSN